MGQRLRLSMKPGEVGNACQVSWEQVTPPWSWSELSGSSWGI